MCCQCMGRREFLGTTTALGAAIAAGAVLTTSSSAMAQGAPAWAETMWDPERPLIAVGKPLRVQPILMYRLPQRREMTSWKSWGGIQTESAVAEETARITDELKALSQRAGFAMEILPVVHVTAQEEASSAHQSGADATIVYPATGSGDMLNACIPDNGAIIFVRHKSGPAYYWYEALSTRYLRKDGEPPDTGKKASVNDVVVDDMDELLWRLRGFYGARNFLGARVVAIGGPQGKYAPDAPAIARDKYKFDIVDVSYDELGKRIESALADAARMTLAERWSSKFLAMPQTTLETERSFVVNAFMLYGLFKDILQEHDAHIITINQCMSTILPMSKTTACLTLGLLNDEGLVAFCESDFVIVPAGILLRYISGKPVFMHNSTFPHSAVVTCAHCAAPRRMNGERYEPVRVLTHYESEFGAAPKVEIPIGQEVTFIDPEYTTGRWVGIKGTVEGNPFLEICRSQQDVRIQGDWKRLLNEVRDSHWMMVYGDYLREVGYAASRMGITWEALS